MFWENSSKRLTWSNSVFNPIMSSGKRELKPKEKSRRLVTLWQYPKFKLKLGFHSGDSPLFENRYYKVVPLLPPFYRVFHFIILLDWNWLRRYMYWNRLVCSLDILHWKVKKWLTLSNLPLVVCFSSSYWSWSWNWTEVVAIALQFANF